jgi:ribosomal protein S18 acetylase RimI-like enzyme
MITIRPATAQDSAFFLQVYAGTRLEEMAVAGWSAEQQAAFLQMQYRAQQQHYQTAYPDATYHVIEHNEQAIGRLILQCTEQELLLMDIALLPPFRNQGIGTHLLRTLQAASEQTGRPIRLSVKSVNPALRLYHRIGFLPVANNGIYIEMIWHPQHPNDASSSQGTTED